MNEERAIYDVATGDPLLRPEGQKMFEQAKNIEAQAKKIREAAAAEQDPAKRQAAEQAAAMREQRASELRGEARTIHAFRVSPDQAKELRATYSAAQTSLELIDEIKELREKHGPKWITTKEGQAAMQSKGTALMMQLKSAWKLGVLSENDQGLLDKATGGDPAKLTLGDVTNFLGAEGPASRLDAVAESVEKAAVNDFKVAGLPGELPLQRKNAHANTEAEKTYQAISADKTPLEQSAGGQGSWLRRNVIDAPGDALRAGKSAVTGDEFRSANEQRKSSAEETGTVYALTQGQERDVKSLIAQAKNANADTPQAIKNRDTAHQRLMELAKHSRTSLATGVLNMLRDSDPDLYKQAVQGLTGERRAFYERLDSGDAGAVDPALAGQSISTLRSLARGGATNLAAGSARQELFRRASAGDQEARAAIASLGTGMK
jgi:hypothetical protein